jgi:hypothetical protein
MYKSSRRYGLQAHIYARNPWSLIRASIRERCPAPARAEALACLLQAQYLYRAATTADEWAAKPLLLYYSFLNLAKALCLTQKVRPTFSAAQHGVSESLRGQRREIEDAFVEVFPSPGKRGPNVLADLWTAVAGGAPATPRQFDLLRLLPQIVAGHRIWCEATDERERFLNVVRLEVMNDAKAKTLWLCIRLFADDLSRLNIGHKQMLKDTQLIGRFREVAGSNEFNRALLNFEQITPLSYRHLPSDEVPVVVGDIRASLWATVASVAPYRRYYLYSAPAAEASSVLPQLVSLYAVLFYLGSVTRYRPQEFDRILDGAFGAHIQEILTSQPAQWLYLMASEFVRREVTQPAIV